MSNNDMNEHDLLALRVRQSQIEQLYRQSRGALTGVTVVAMGLCVVQWPVVSHAPLLAWTACVVAFSLVRLALVRAFERARPAGVAALRWARWHTLGVAISGVLWAIPLLFMWPENSPTHQLIWCLCILPLSAASVVTYYASKPAYLTFLALTGIPVASRLLNEGGVTFGVTGVLGFFFIFVLVKAGRLLYAASVATLETGHRNEALNRRLQQEIVDHKHLQRQLAERNRQLELALTNVKQLSGLLPICGSCKKVRNDEGYWEQIEAYIRQRSEAQFSHGICPECAQQQFPDLF